MDNSMVPQDMLLNIHNGLIHKQEVETAWIGDGVGTLTHILVMFRLVMMDEQA